MCDVMQDPLSTAFCSPHIEWQHQPKQLDRLSKAECLWEQGDEDFEPPCTFRKWVQSLDIDFIQAFGDNEIVQITANNGLLGWLFDRPAHASHLQTMGLTRDNAYGCLSNFLFQAAPNLQRQLPRGVLQVLKTNTVIGIQIRYMYIHTRSQTHLYCASRLSMCNGHMKCVFCLKI